MTITMTKEAAIDTLTIKITLQEAIFKCTRVYLRKLSVHIGEREGAGHPKIESKFN